MLHHYVLVETQKYFLVQKFLHSPVFASSESSFSTAIACVGREQQGLHCICGCTKPFTAAQSAGPARLVSCRVSWWTSASSSLLVGTVKPQSTGTCLLACLLDEDGTPELLLSQSVSVGSAKWQGSDLGLTRLCSAFETRTTKKSSWLFYSVRFPDIQTSLGS